MVHKIIAMPGSSYSSYTYVFSERLLYEIESQQQKNNNITTNKKAKNNLSSIYVVRK